MPAYEICGILCIAGIALAVFVAIVGSMWIARNMRSRF